MFIISLTISAIAGIVGLLSVNQPNSGDEELDYYDPIGRKDAYQGMEKLIQFLETIPFFDRRVTSQLCLLAMDFSERGHLDEAEACVRKALWATSQYDDSEHERCDFLAVLGNTLKQQGRFAEAESTLREAYELADNYPMRLSICERVARDLAVLFETQGKAHEASAWKERVEILKKGQIDELRRRVDGNS